MRSSILVVDDDPLVREALVDELTATYEVTPAECGGDALGVLGTRRFDAVISDQRMPDISGIAVLERGRAGGGFSPVG